MQSKMIQLPIGYVVDSANAAFNAGINGMAVVALAESFGDNMEEKFPNGGIMFSYPYNPNRRQIWVIVSNSSPFVIDPEANTAAIKAENARLQAALQRVRSRCISWDNNHDLFYCTFCGALDINTNACTDFSELRAAFNHDANCPFYEEL